MESRHKALEAFYGGSTWSAHRDEANNTMVDTDDVLLLRPARPGYAFHLGASTGNPWHAEEPATVLAGIYQLSRPVDAQHLSQFELKVARTLEASGVKVVGVFVTEVAPNTFTRLPVREGENVFVWFGVVRGGEPPREWNAALASAIPLDDVPVLLLELEPTPAGTKTVCSSLVLIPDERSS